MELLEKVKLSVFREWGTFYKLWIKMVDSVNVLIDTYNNTTTELPEAGDSGNVLTSNGTTWESSALPEAGYKVYKAILKQSGTDAPVATVLENTVGEVVWSRQSVGSYRATLQGAFPEGKCIFRINSGTTSAFSYSLIRNDTDTMALLVYSVEVSGTSLTFTAIDNNLSILSYDNISIEIYVYP